MAQKKIVGLFVILLMVNQTASGQGRAYNFLLGYNTLTDTFTLSPKGRLLFDSVNVSVLQDSFKMKFRATQANISDENGNLLFYTNGQWIADASHDTMQNGAGLNPGSLVNGSQFGMPFPDANLVLPYPGNPSRYILFHQTGVVGLNYMSPEIFTTIIDMDSANGLGAVISKNQVVLSDSLCQGMNACKHANGRDWWITVLKDSSDIIYKMLLTPQGVSSITSQNLNDTGHPLFNYQSCFSPNGKKFAYSYVNFRPNGIYFHEIRIFDFDRCNGIFNLDTIVEITGADTAGQGLSFSSNSKYLYACTFSNIYQYNVDTTNIAASKQLVAINDTFYSPFPPFQTDFWLMYLAPNGKIYISSGNSVIDMHYINYPDSAGLACDVQQHALPLPCYVTRAHVNHPNYYLGADTSSACDTLTSLPGSPDASGGGAYYFKFKLYPNPSQGFFTINYLLPQNQKGTFEVFDITGNKVFNYTLPPWSTLQNFDLRFLSSGVYSCAITSANQRISKRIALLNTK